jgi:S-adenosylmethionine decarboxylase proenzyme
MSIVGNHTILELIGVPDEKFMRGEIYVDDIKNIIIKNGGTVLNSCFHNFEPHGTTILLLLSESHFSLHTWNENNYIAIDLFTCGLINNEKIINEIINYFNPNDYVVNKFERGNKKIL